MQPLPRVCRHRARSRRAPSPGGRCSPTRPCRRSRGRGRRRAGHRASRICRHADGVFFLDRIGGVGVHRGAAFGRQHDQVRRLRAAANAPACRRARTRCCRSGRPRARPSSCREWAVRRRRAASAVRSGRAGRRRSSNGDVGKSQHGDEVMVRPSCPACAGTTRHWRSGAGAGLPATRPRCRARRVSPSLTRSTLTASTSTLTYLRITSSSSRCSIGR